MAVVNRTRFVMLALSCSLLACDAKDESKGQLDSRDALSDVDAAAATESDAGASSDSPGTRELRAEIDACRAEVVAKVSQVPQFAEPREACSEAQVQAVAECLAGSDCKEWIKDNRECSECVFTTLEVRGPYYTDSASASPVPNSAGCMALRSNAQCGQALYDREVCLNQACAACDDQLACNKVALQEDCEEIDETVKRSCKRVPDLENIGAGCLMSFDSEAEKRAAGAAIVRSFCASKPQRGPLDRPEGMPPIFEG